MSKHASYLPLAGIELDRRRSAPLHRQLYEQLRQAILTQQLAAGSRLPPTRDLATALGISRLTAVNAFDQLLAEGYIEGKVGSGTFVRRGLPEDSLQVLEETRGKAPSRAPSRALSKRGAALAEISLNSWREVGKPRAFRAGAPALDAFPLDLWRQLANRSWRGLPREALAYGDPAGYRPLRQAIAAYLGVSRGVRCTPDQVLIVSGSQQALEIAARVLIDPGDQVWLEDPGYRGARGVMQAAGTRIVPVPVDQEGLQIRAGLSKGAGAKAVYVTPSHQYPLGVTMSLARRLALLEWAKRTGAWILEDDYDSEYRYVGRPLPALQGLDTAQRVIYIGTFSKVLFPSLRLGYMVVPDDLVKVFRRGRALIDRQPPILEQVVLATFITEDHFARHLRRMRMLYAGRQETLVQALHDELGDRIEVPHSEAGLQLVAWLPKGMDDRLLSQQAAALQVEAAPLSAYAMSHLNRGGLVLGFAGVNESEIREGARRLKKAFDATEHPRSHH